MTASAVATDSILNNLIDELTAKLQAGEPVDLDVVIAEHPEHADALRRLVPALLVLADLSNSMVRSDPIHRVLGDGGADSGTLGDFRLIREVGRGGMGIVYEAEQISLNRHVALKVLPFAATMDPRQLQRFRNKAQAAACLHHPNIVPVHGVGVERGVHYYAMQLIEGQTLAEVIAASRAQVFSSRERERPESRRASQRERDVEDSHVALTPRRSPSTAAIALLSTKRDRTHFRSIAALIASAADALEYAHSMGVLHRDIKPGNLMLDNGGGLWITDFGLAKVVASLRDAEPGCGATRLLPDLTLTGDMIGTLRYMSPEAALAKHGIVDHRTDIYSLGATLYELLTLQPAVDGDDKGEILKAIAWDDPTPLRKHDKSIPAELETITLKCLAKEPSERYATAGEMAADLRRWMGDRAIKAKPPGRRERAAKWSRKHRGILAVALAGVMLSVGALIVGYVRERHTAQDEATQRKRAQANLRLALDALGDTSWPAMQALLERPGPLGQQELKPIRELLAFYERFAQENSDDLNVRYETSKARLRAGELYQQLGQDETAEREFRAGVATIDDIARNHPELPVVFALRVTAQGQLAKFLVGKGRLDEAVPLLRSAIETVESLSANPPKSTPLLEYLQEAHGLLAQTFTDRSEIEHHRRRAIDYSEQLLAIEPNSARFRSRLGAEVNNLAWALTQFGRFDEAELLITRAIENQHEAIKLEPRNPTYRLFLRNHLAVRAQIADARNQPTEVLKAVNEQVVIMKRLSEEFPAIPDYRFRLAMSFSLQAKSLNRSGKRGDAIVALQRSQALLETLVSEVPSEGKYRSESHIASYNLGVCLNEIGRQAEAIKYFAKIPETCAPYAESARGRAWIRLTATDQSLRDPAEALRLAIWGFSQWPQIADWPMKLAFAQMRSGDSKAALATLDKVPKDPPGEIDLYFLRAMILHSLGRREEARATCISAIQAMDKSQRDSESPMLLVYRREAIAELGLTEADIEKR